jgi:hypothetical protein
MEVLAPSPPPPPQLDNIVTILQDIGYRIPKEPLHKFKIVYS